MYTSLCDSCLPRPGSAATQCFTLKHVIFLLETYTFHTEWEKASEVFPSIRKIPLEEEMATHSSILAWRIPQTEEPCGLQSTGSKRVRHDWAIEHACTLLQSKLYCQ